MEFFFFFFKSTSSLGVSLSKPQTPNSKGLTFCPHVGCQNPQKANVPSTGTSLLAQWPNALVFMSLSYSAQIFCLLPYKISYTFFKCPIFYTFLAIGFEDDLFHHTIKTRNKIVPLQKITRGYHQLG